MNKIMREAREMGQVGCKVLYNVDVSEISRSSPPVPVLSLIIFPQPRLPNIGDESSLEMNRLTSRQWGFFTLSTFATQFLVWVCRTSCGSVVFLFFRN